MTLLDRFRTQPPHKHPDPAIRLAHVAELALDDLEAIAAMAREDSEPRVRRAAVAKLMDPSALADIAQSDPDESVRAVAVEMLRDLAVEAFDGTGEAESLAAVDGLADARVLAQVARSAPREAVALRALTRVTDARLLGSIARHALSDRARSGALAALQAREDTAEIVAIALNGEFKDTAAAAVDLVATRSELEHIATRSKNKSAIKRARTILRQMDEQAQEVQSPMSTDALLDSASSSEPAETAPVVEVAGEEANRLENAARQQEAEQAALARQEEDSAAERDRQLAMAAAAVDAAVRRQTQLTSLADDAVVAAELEDIGAARSRFTSLRRAWRDLSTSGEIEASLAARYADADARFAARDQAVHDADSKVRREGLARMHNLLGRVEQLAGKPDISLKAADRALRDVRAALSGIPQLPTKADYDDVSTRMKAVAEALTPKVNELREADDWQKWANVTIQEQLCVKMEALNALDDPEVIAREVRELQLHWRQAADVPRDKADALWRRFKAAHDMVWARCESHFAEQAQVRAENLTRKIALCEQAEGFAESTNWIQTADAIKKLQADWKAIGPVSRGREKAIWDRFRTACDRFFTRRHDDLAQRKGVWAENLARKDALCVRAEALADSTEWDAAAAEIRRLQAEWKTVGPVKKSRSEAIWQRFRSACDRFFERHAQRHDTARAERVAAREAICAEIEALTSVDDQTAEPPADLLTTVRGLRARWQQEIAGRGVDADTARALDTRFADAFAGVLARWPAPFSGTDLDPDANRKRMEALVKKIEDLATSLSGPAATPEATLSPADRLAAMLKEALAANTIGGKAEDDSRWRAAAEDVRQAQAAWSRLGPVPDATRRLLADRFQRAARKITDKVDAATRSSSVGRAPNRPSGAGRPSGPGRSEPRREHAGSEK